jgi:GAF domain-containing protein
VAAAAGSIATPVEHSRLLEMIVETASGVIPSRSAALFLIDEGTEELVFQVALGPEAQQVRDLRVPLGHGIAGLVAVSGQPMAVSDAAEDPRQAADIAQSVGYAPGTVLCVPLFYDEEVIGVLELLDREGAATYGTQDIVTLGHFANQAAVAIEQSLAQGSVAALLREALSSSDGTGQNLLSSRTVEERVEEFAAGVERDPSHLRALELARLVGEISRRGEREVEACRTILEGFADYLRSRPEDVGDLAEDFG